MNDLKWFVCCMLILSVLIAPAYANERQYLRLIDNAELLTEGEKLELLDKLDEISERNEFDVAIITANSLKGSSASEYADALYDTYGYGFGENDDGMLFLIGMEERDWAISTHGFGIEAFSDAGQEYMVNQFKEKLSSGDYAGAFNIYADLCDDFIIQAENGAPYDSGTLPKGAASPYLPLYSILIGALIAFIVVGIMKGQLKSVRMQRAATAYVKDNSLDMAVSRDLFLYSTVSRIKIEKPKPSGSSTHRSSSGRTHGGSSGKF